MHTVIYLVRHGEVDNPDQIFYGRLPGFPLTPIGRKQAHILGKYLSGKTISALYASPLHRTRETATIIASYHNNLSIVHDERLLEVHSLTQGRKIVDMAAERWNFYNPKYTKLGGERLSDIWSRMRQALLDVVKKHRGQEVVVVSHGDPIMIAMIKHKGRSLRLNEIRGEEYVQTANGYKLEFEGYKATGASKLDL